MVAVLEPKVVEKKLRELIAAATGGRVRAEDLRPEQTLVNHLGLTSLALVAMLFQFEEEFGIDTQGLAFDPSMFRTVDSVLRRGRELICGQKLEP
jgi:acyl carrier protein